MKEGGQLENCKNQDKKYTSSKETKQWGLREEHIFCSYLGGKI